jgi:phosphotriesterase-related protein
MSQVSTVRGPVEAADLGPTYMHEHIFVLTADVQQNYPGEWGSEDERIADAVTKLGALAAQGVRTIVDPTVVGLGRNLPRIQRVAEQVPSSTSSSPPVCTPTTACRSSSTTAGPR